MTNTRKNIAKLSAVILTIALVWILLSQIQISDIITTLASIDPIYLIIGFILYVCSYFFRALRFHILLNHKVSVKDLFAIVCVHNAANNILPARTGELSYVYLVKKLHGIPTGEVLAGLMVARVFDFIILGLIFFISVLFVQDLPKLILQVILIVLVSVVAIVLILLFVTLYGVKSANTIERLVSKTVLKQFYLIDYLIRKIQEVAKSLVLIGSKSHVVYYFLISAMLWFFNYLMSYILVINMGIQLSVWNIIFAFTFTVWASILPIHGLGGFGTAESVWTIVFMSLNVSKELAISSGFAFHIVLLLFTLAISIYGLLKLYAHKDLSSFSSN